MQAASSPPHFIPLITSQKRSGEERDFVRDVGLGGGGNSELSRLHFTNDKKKSLLIRN